jgi:hypothetical protein
VAKPQLLTPEGFPYRAHHGYPAASAGAGAAQADTAIAQPAINSAIFFKTFSRMGCWLRTFLSLS